MYDNLFRKIFLGASSFIFSTRYLLGFSVHGFPTEEMRAGRSRRRRRHSSPLGAMSGREGVLDEPPLIEILDEPPIGN